MLNDANYWWKTYLEYRSKLWEHWCHCHEMFVWLKDDEKCDTCGRTKEDKDK